MSNDKLTAARSVKNDEFYTTMEEIQSELKHYEDKFAGKTVFCNCDDPFVSNFVRYFLTNFHRLGLKRLFAAGYRANFMSGRAYGLRVDSGDVSPEADRSTALSLSGVFFFLSGDKTGPYVRAGDFRSEDSLRMLIESDIVVTNPPFSLFREYVDLLVRYEKQFLIVGNKNAVTYRDIFPLLKENRMWLGVGSMNGGRVMIVPKNVPMSSKYLKPGQNGDMLLSIPGVCWFTNLDHAKRHERLSLSLSSVYAGNEVHYPRYDNYDAIEVSKVAEIPCDYDGVMGVPITFLDKYCPEQFEIVGASESEGRGFSAGLWDSESRVSQPLVNGRRVYKRLFIQSRT